MEQIEHRYALDTCAINKLCDSEDDFSALIDSVGRGFEYYITDIQCDEIKNALYPKKERSHGSLVSASRANRALDLMETILHIRPKIDPQFATFFPGGWPLDGSRALMPDGEIDAWKMYLDIRGTDLWSRHSNDAMIALVAIVNGCALVTRDKRLGSRVNKHFPGRSIFYDDFIRKLAL